MRNLALLLVTLFALAAFGSAYAGGAGCSYGWKATENSSPAPVDKTRTASPAIKSINTEG